MCDGSYKLEFYRKMCIHFAKRARFFIHSFSKAKMKSKKVKEF